MGLLSRSKFLRGHWATRQAEYQPSDAYQADIGHRCLAINQVLCRSCEDSCDFRAISFKPKPNGIPTPSVNPELCDGCGECFRLCPANAIKMVALQETGTPASTDSPPPKARS